tara:strand:- start:309 stop:1718 length:1410 start_codon:yes stop_codon:yes gene_type:complete
MEIEELGLPDSIKEFDAPENFHKNKNEEYDYDAYQYEFVLLEDTIIDDVVVPKGKWMKGAHLGVFDLSYWTSCENKEFRKIFQGSKPLLKLRIYNTVKGDDAWSVVKQAEHVELTELNARKDKMSWNGNNGFPSYKRIRRELCNPIVQQLKVDMPFGKGNYDCGTEPILDHLKMPSLQVRASWDGTFVHNVTVAVDDEGGNTKNTDRVVVWEGRSIFGGDLRGDGNQTVAGVANSKSGKAGTAEIKVSRIPFEDSKHLSDLEVEHIGNMLNKKAKKFYRPTDEGDSTKIILKLVANGAKIKTPEHDKILKDDYGLNSKQRANVYKDVVDALHEKKLKIINRTYADYTLPHLAPLKTAKIEKLSQDVSCLTISTSVGVGFKWMDMIATAIRDAKKDKKYYDDGNLETGNFIVKSVRLLLDYKQSVAARTSFRNELWPDFKTKYEALGSTITLIDYEEMDLTVASTTSKAT